MPPSNVLFARLSKLSLLCALLVMGLTPSALGYAYNTQAIGLQAQAANPAISLTPRSGPKGYRVGVSGSGFAPKSTITLAVDGSPVSANCTANASGTFSNCAFTPPPETGGIHTVTASDQMANAAAAMYNASTFAASIIPRPPASRTSSGGATNTGENPTVRLSSGAGKVGSKI